MRSHPRSHRSDRQRPETALRGGILEPPPPVDVDGGGGGAVAIGRRGDAGGLSGAGPGTPEKLDLIATGAGLVIGHPDNPELAVPSLVPWSLVRCSVTDAGAGDAGEPTAADPVVDL
jgi:hypothetical protein